MGSCKTAGPQCGHRNPADIQDGTLCRAESPKAGPVGVWDRIETDLGAAYQYAGRFALTETEYATQVASRLVHSLVGLSSHVAEFVVAGHVLVCCQKLKNDHKAMTDCNDFVKKVCHGFGIHILDLLDANGMVDAFEKPPFKTIEYPKADPKTDPGGFDIWEIAREL